MNLKENENIILVHRLKRNCDVLLFFFLLWKLFSSWKLDYFILETSFRMLKMASWSSFMTRKFLEIMLKKLMMKKKSKNKSLMAKSLLKIWGNNIGSADLKIFTLQSLLKKMMVKKRTKNKSLLAKILLKTWTNYVGSADLKIFTLVILLKKLLIMRRTNKKSLMVKKHEQIKLLQQILWSSHYRYKTLLKVLSKSTDNSLFLRNTFIFILTFLFNAMRMFLYIAYVHLF